MDRSEEKQKTTFKDKKCYACRSKKFWDNSKTPAVNIEEVGHEDMNQDVNYFIDFDEDVYIIVEKDS